MLQTEQLYELIQSLSASEKRAFKLQASLQNGSKNYLALFDILDEMDPFDEEGVHQEIAIRELDMNFSGTQSYLYQKVLDTICILSTDEFLDAKISKFIHEAKVLERRGLFKLSSEALQKAYKLAKKNDRNHLLIEILNLIAYQNALQQTKKLTEKVDAIFFEAKESTANLKQEVQLHQLNQWFYSYTIRKRYYNKSIDLESLKPQLEKIQRIDPSTLKTFYSKLYYYNAKGFYHYLIQDSNNTKKDLEQVIATWTEFPEMIGNNIRAYIYNISNLLNSYISAKEFPQVLNLLNKVQKINPKTFYESALKFQVYNYCKLLYLLNLYKYDEAVSFIENFADDIEVYQKALKQSSLLGFYYNITIAYFLTQNYEKADEWLEKILSITRTDESRKDIQRFARILQLAIYYQLGNHEMLEYMIRSVYRNKLVKEDMQPFDKLILKYYKKLQKVVPHSAEAFALFEKLKEKLDELEEDQHLLTGYEDFNAWLDMILEKKKK